MRTRSLFVALLLLGATLMPQGIGAVPPAAFERNFAVPIDGLSIAISSQSEEQKVSAWDGDHWTAWQELRLEDEQDAALKESNLVMFPRAVSRIRFINPIADSDLHPIRVSHAPSQFQVASTTMEAHHILSRSDWGADESLLISGGETTKSDIGDNGDASSNGKPEATAGRVKDCNDMYAKYSSEFKTSAAVTKNAAGQNLRWPQQYSPQVRLLVVHHTAQKVSGDSRPGVERMRALYQYHAANRGWGDIGYHFVIDDQGQVYEGRAGGDSIVGGHAYCNNVSTIGVALMGNFDLEQPTQTQAESLQWLLRLLAEKYHIDPSSNLIFHGKSLPTIVGHRQLLSTDCPGLAMWSVLDQVRDHVRTGNTDAPVDFPQIETIPGIDQTSPDEGSGKTIPVDSTGLASLGQTTIQGRPGAEVILSVFFRATTKAYSGNTRIARVTRSKDMLVWQEREGSFVPVIGDLRIPVPLLKMGESVLLRIKVQLPLARGNAALKIGTLNYTFEMSGRVARGRQLLSPSGGGTQLTENAVLRQQTVTSRPSTRTTQQSSPPVGAVREPPLPPSTSSSATPRSSSPLIRILIQQTASRSAGSAMIMTSAPATVNGARMDKSTISISMLYDKCIASDGTHFINDQRRVRIVPDDSIFTILLQGKERTYRGTLECQILDDQMTLINELPLEEYLAGLAEEPDGEPAQKQKAFAITARTYATYYLDPTNRKFPGKPYDGADSPATFQSYQGYDFEQQNPDWARAVKESSGQVLTYKGAVIKPPYFSSDTGRTRTPADAGWKNFPFAEIFTAKDDHWCNGMALNGHGVGMSGCGAKAQAKEGRTAEEILGYYYPGTVIGKR